MCNGNTKCKSCAIKMNGMKKKKRAIGAMGSDYLTELMMDLSPAAGAIAAHEIKSMIPASYKTMLGAQSDYIINGIGVASVVLPHVLGLKGETKELARGIASGVAAECALAAYMKFRGQTSIGGWDNKAYALAAAKNRLRVAGLDNKAPGLMGPFADQFRDKMNAASPGGGANGINASWACQQNPKGPGCENAMAVPRSSVAMRSNSMYHNNGL